MTPLCHKVPTLGSGIGYRAAISHSILKHKNEIEVLEVITEHYINEKKSSGVPIEQLCENFRVVPHGLNLSICSPHLDKSYIEKVYEFIKKIKPHYYTDHLALTSCPGIDIGHLSPIIYDYDTLNIVIDNVNRLQDYFGIPLALENITYNFSHSDNCLIYSEFVNNLVDKTDCGLLLDLTNLYINAFNHEFDATDFINHLPLNNILHIHIAGEYELNGKLIDGHCCAVQKGTWDLLSYLMQKAKPAAIILEHDADFPNNFRELLDTVVRAKTYLN